MHRQASLWGHRDLDIVMDYYWSDYALAAGLSLLAFVPAALRVAMGDVDHRRERLVLYAAGPLVMAVALAAQRWPLAPI